MRLKNFITALLFFQISVSFGQVHPGTKWWYEEPYRLIQTNLREIDAIDVKIFTFRSMLNDRSHGK